MRSLVNLPPNGETRRANSFFRGVYEALPGAFPAALTGIRSPFKLLRLFAYVIRAALGNSSGPHVRGELKRD